MAFLSEKPFFILFIFRKLHIIFIDSYNQRDVLLVFRKVNYMKRSELQHRRNIARTNRMPNVHARHKEVGTNDSRQHLFPIMHISQIFIFILLFLFLFIYQNSISDKEISNIFTVLHHHLNNSIDLQFSEWSGTLKDILIIRK